MFERTHSDCEAPAPHSYLAASSPLLQSVINTLIDIDIAYEREREKLIKSRHLPSRRLEMLKQQHRERREPYIQQLAVLLEGA
jgi:hypothetical protein